MSRMLLASLACLLLPSTGLADPIFLLKGQSAAVDSNTNGTYAVQGGTLSILQGARILSAAAAYDGAIAMSGGRVDAGIEVSGGTFQASGGSSTGFDSTAYGGDGLSVSSTASILGGTFTGGNSGGQAGSGVVGSAGEANGLPFVSNLDIRGGTFAGGTGSGGYYGGTTGYSLLSLGDATVTGGHFLSPIAINAAFGGVTNFLGKSLSYDPATSVLSGTLADGDLINVHVYLSGGYATVSPDGTQVRFAASTSSPTDPGTGAGSGSGTGSGSTGGTGTGSNPAPPPVPEPGTFTIFGVMALAAMTCGRHRHRRKSETAG
ncbi:hypothetical protein OJF2_60420 [Aquisphaera giovannonii]|uniref:PEP-CTERM protein-sorting domain-containing protein n=1 Tax=Aquisphaera giovannonii TaxID=406548 RepID=A0A5B9WBR5_9BACT|nr:hypothetical protein [Aquisphaera giovannonii]QEH37451.1 hypothetical protein OJF2_60420 [Aquisphaera giovannonii]